MPKLLVLADSSGSSILPTTAAAIGFAQQFAPNDFSILLIGAPELQAKAQPLQTFNAQSVLLALLPELANPTADRAAYACEKAMRTLQASWLVGTASSFGRDVLPRVAGLLDLPMLSDIISLQQDAAGPLFQRPAYAGNLLQTFRPTADEGVLSVRASAFQPTCSETLSPLATLSLDPQELPTTTTWLGQESSEKKRPDLSAARVVVAGGRPLKDAVTFERLIGGLADRLGGAVGATRAAVDSGIAPNELQIGQTGRVVSPDLYIAVGISGSVQHLAGMKDSKVIVAINKDPDAPIFEVADYGLVADLYEAIPELLEKL